MTFTVPIAESDVTSLVADLAAKAPLASPTLTSTPSFPTGTIAVTQTAANSSTRLATTAYMDTAKASKANLASPTLTGTVTVPNGASATNIAAYGQIPVPGTVGGPGKTVFRTGDATPIASDNSTNNDDTLLWAVGASDRWLFQAYLTFTATGGGATGDLSMDFSLPASGAVQWGSLGFSTNLTPAGYGFTATGGAPGALVTGASTLPEGGFDGTWGVAISGFYTGGGTSGTVTFRWSQRVSNAATLTINKNSIFLLWRVA